MSRNIIIINGPPTGIASVEPTAAVGAGAAATASPHPSSANTFFFDDYNATRTTSSTAGYPATGGSSTAALSSSLDQSQSPMPSEVAAADLSHFAITPGVRPDKASVKAAGSNEISNSTPIKNLITSFGRPALVADQQEQQQQLPGPTAAVAVAVAATTTTATTAALAATLKSAKSTIKQPIDSTRSRNHWTVGGGGGKSGAKANVGADFTLEKEIVKVVRKLHKIK